MNRTNNSYSELERLNVIARRIAASGVDITANYHVWTLIAYACASQGEQGRKAFHLVSSSYPGYSHDNCDRHFTNCLKTSRNNVNLTTLVKWAQVYGINISDAHQSESVIKTRSFDSSRNANGYQLAKTVTDGKTELLAVIDELLARKANIAESYHDWWRLGCALAWELGEEGREAYHQLSSASTKYDPTECDRKWAECLRVSDGRTTKGTIFWMAEQAGIDISAL